MDGERSSRNLQPSKGVAKSVIERTHVDLIIERLDAIQRRLDNNLHIPKEETLKLAEYAQHVVSVENLVMCRKIALKR